MKKNIAVSLLLIMILLAGSAYAQAVKCCKKAASCCAANPACCVKK